uniref:Endoplasmic reticulum resident protein 44 n=1 Tax=Hemiscolopendra marginata TaxID=943146 RepID=A0A646QDC0_9MYRI
MFFTVSSLFFTLTDSGSTQLTMANFDGLVATHEVVFLNFYADWCRFSQILAPVFDEAADKLAQEVPGQGKALLGKIDCDAESSLAARFHISKYPTLKVIRQGFVAKREYRGQRSAEALVNFVVEQLKDPIKELTTLADLQNIEDKKRATIALFQNKTVASYDVFRRVAMNLQEDCEFYIGAGSEFQSLKENGEDTILFRPSYSKDGSKDQRLTFNLTDFNQLNAWTTKNCIPLVREITFENAEEFTEEGLPFLILFHHPDDKEIVEKYNEVVATQLMEDKTNINFLTADGLKFAHPLHHLGKSVSDLPLIAIDSFRHMYLFPDIKRMSEPGTLKSFVDDLYSGKLHREFHYGPEHRHEIQPETESQPSERADDTQEPKKDAKGPTTPPESTFKKLAPSRNRYTLLRDEL